MSEPLDVPDDRFVSLEDMLYAAGSAFARPSPELEEYYVTARKHEAEALAQPEMPDSVTKPDEVTKQKPEGIARPSDIGNEYPNYNNEIHSQTGETLPEAMVEALSTSKASLIQTVK